MLHPAHLIDRARLATGLDDFGGDGFREGLERLVAALTREARLNAPGEAALTAQIVDLMQAWREATPREQHMIDLDAFAIDRAALRDRFGFYPPHDDGSAGYGQGFVWRGGQWCAAKPVAVPWLRDVRFEGDDVGLELAAGGETIRIGGQTVLSTFRIGNPDIGGLDLHQGSAWYEWDGQRAMGMIERSSHESQTRIVTA